mmetsp:Transcript_136824/g.355037  ORF Transcript_136824/g.355037 Transcript_136824/m.355037 type:complete len:159 (-) Transcript_136824:246-722(-)
MGQSLKRSPFWQPAWPPSVPSLRCAGSLLTLQPRCRAGEDRGVLPSRSDPSCCMNRFDAWSMSLAMFAQGGRQVALAVRQIASLARLVLDAPHALHRSSNHISDNQGSWRCGCSFFAPRRLRFHPSSQAMARCAQCEEWQSASLAKPKCRRQEGMAHL